MGLWILGRGKKGCLLTSYRREAKDYLQTSMQSYYLMVWTLVPLSQLSAYFRTIFKSIKEIISRIGTIEIRQFTNPAEAHSLQKTALQG